MSTPLNTVLDLGGARRIINLGDAVNPNEPVTLQQMQSQLEGVAWKDSARVRTSANVTISSPGATLDGVSMVSGDRVLLSGQTSLPENGIYIWNGAAVPMTRSLDASTFTELESAVISVEEGSSQGTQWRQTQVNGVIGTNDVLWTAFATAAPSATETTAGIAELATQAETDAGTDDTKIVTPFKLATYAGRAKRYSQNVGDGSATSLVVTHNLNTDDTQVYVRETGGSKRAVICEVQHTSVNSVTLLFDSAPALNAYRVTVIA